MTEKIPGEIKHQHCSVCGYNNPEGVLNCQNCGTPLVDSGRSLAEARKASEATTSDKTAEKPTEITAQRPASQPAEPPAQQVAPNSAASRPPAVPEPVSPLPAPSAAPEPTTPDETAPPIRATLREEGETVASSPPTWQFGNPTLCPHCGHYNRPGTLICDNCGTNLSTGEHPKFSTASLGNDLPLPRGTTAAETGTKPLPSPQKLVPQMSTEEIRAVQTAGAELFQDDMILRLEVSGAPTPILVYPSAETIIGRRDPISSGVPDVDLTAYAGYRMGVSRQHAVLRLQSKVLDIRDLGSSNGTFVNGVRLSPHQPHLLRDGDEIGLGKMVIKVFFQSGARRKTAADLTPPP
jgi:hypothetical protein